MFKDEIAQLRRSGVRHLLTQALSTALVLSTALMMWKGLSVICNTESPVVVVLSESMEPAIQRGDLLFLTMPRSAPLHHDDITVYKVPGAPVPIVHRIIETHDEKNSSEQWILTKGDNNQADDVGLYNGMRYLRRSHIVGKVQGYIPYVGYGTILMDSLRTCLFSRGQNCAALQELVRAPTSSLAALSRGGGGGGIPRKYTGGR